MKRIAQSTIEYMVMVAVVAAALVAMSVYGKRAIQGRIRAGADQVSSESAYMPRGTQGNITVRRNMVEQSQTYVDKTGGRRDSVTDAALTVDQDVIRDEKAGVVPGG